MRHRGKIHFTIIISLFLEMLQNKNGNNRHYSFQKDKDIKLVTDDDLRRPMAAGQLRDSGDLKKPIVVFWDNLKLYISTKSKG